MDVTRQRAQHSDDTLDWRAAARRLEQRIAASEDERDRAALHLELGALFRDKLLDGRRALEQFRESFDWAPSQAASAALSGQLWQAGDFSALAVHLGREVEAAPEGLARAELAVELGDALSELGKPEEATAAYALALRASGGKLSEASELLLDVQSGPEDWQERIGELLRAAHEAESGAARARVFLRAARIARRFAPEEAEGILAQAYRANPLGLVEGSLYERALAKRGQTDALVEAQRGLLAEAGGPERAALAYGFARRWALQHQDSAKSAPLAEESLRLDPRNDEAFGYLCDAYGERQGDWERVLTLADALASDSRTPASVLARAFSLAAREEADGPRAARYCALLVQAAPEHPALRAYDEAFRRMSEDRMPKADDQSETPSTPSVRGESDASPSSQEAPAAAAPASRRASLEGAGTPEEIAALRATLEKQRAANRMADYVKTLAALAAAVDDVDEKVAFLLEAAELYATRFANTAEAMRTFELVREVAPENAVAREQLRAIYDKRRDFEKLVALMRADAERLPHGDARTSAFRKLAELATERIKKPEVCIGLWSEVVELAPRDADALGQLAQFLEKARSFERLAEVLAQLVAETPDKASRIELLTKLAQVTGDRLKDDARAVEAYAALAELEPGNPRHEEQLKKRYIALARWDDLERLYQRTERWDELIRVLESQESRTEDADEKSRMLLKIGELYTTQKGQPERAVRAYEKILALDPRALEAAERLIPIYTHAGNPKGLAGVLEVKLGAVPAEALAERVALLRQLAALYEQRLGDPAAALTRLVAAFRAEPTDLGVQGELERVAGEAGAWGEVVAAYEAALTALEEGGEAPEAALALRLRLAAILAEQLAEPARAAAAYAEALVRDPENQAAFEALSRLYAEAGAWAALLGLVDHRRALVSGTNEELVLLLRGAQIHEEKLGDLPRAIEAYLAYAAERPEDDAPLAALDRLYERTGDWLAVTETLGRRIDLLPAEAELVRHKLRLADTQFGRLGDAAAALETYRDVLLLDQENADAREALEGFLESESLAGRAAAVLEPVYEAQGDFEKLVRALEVLVRSAADADEQVALLQRVAVTAAAMLGDRARACDAYARALALAPARADVRAELGAMSEDERFSARVADVYEALAAATTGELQRTYRLGLAELAARLGNVERAASALKDALEADPRDAAALGELEALYRGAERWEDLIGALGRKLELEADEARQDELLEEIAALYELRLGRVADAARVLTSALEARPDARRLLAALEALHARAEDWPALAETLRAELALAEDEPSRLALVLRLASLAETRLGDVAGAIEGYRQVLESEPSSAVALGALERLRAQPAVELGICDILEPLYRERGMLAELVAVVEARVSRAETAAERLGLLLRIADIHEELAGDVEAAFGALSRALPLASDDAGLLQRTEQLGRASGRVTELAELVERLGRSAEGAVAVELLMTAARLAEDQLGDAARAVALYAAVRQWDAENLEALLALERGTRALGRMEELAELLVAKAGLLTEPEAQKTALYQAADLYEAHLGRPERAVAALEKVLELAPSDASALDALARLLRGLSRWEALIAVRERQADVAMHATERRALLADIAEIQERELGARDAAIETYRRVLDLDPEDGAALARLDALFAQAGDFAELLHVLQRRADLAVGLAALEPGSAERAREALGLRARVAALHANELGEPERAVELYRDILADAPGDEGALGALEVILRAKSAPAASAAAAAVLESAYEGLRAWERLVSVLRVEVGQAGDAFAAVDLLHRVAQLEEDRLAAPSAAFATISEAVRLDSQSEASLMSLERLALQLGRWSEVTDLYDAELSRLGDERERTIELGLRVAQLYEVQLEQAAAAIDRYRRVAELDTDNLTALRALDRLYTETSRWSELADVLRREADLGQTPEEILDLKHRRGQVHQFRLGALDEAIAAYGEILAAAPEHEAARASLEEIFFSGQRCAEIGEILEPLYQAAGEWERLVQVELARLDATSDAGARLALFCRIAEDVEERLLDPSRALDVYARALREHPLDARVGDELERLAAATDDGWQRLANAYVDAIGASGASAEARTALGKRLARVFEEELGDADKAEESLRFVLGVAPSDADALAELDRLYSARGKAAELADVLERRLAGSELGHEQIEYALRLGRLYDGVLARQDDAVRVYRLVIDGLEPACEEALRPLERIYEARADWTALDALLEGELRHAVGDVQEAEIRAKRALVAAEHLGKVDEAIEAWQRVLDLRGEDPEALGALARLYEKQSRWEELTELLERQLDVSESTEARVAVLAHRARVFAEHLGRAEEALETRRRILEVDPGHLPTLRLLAAGFRASEAWEELAEMLAAEVTHARAALEQRELLAALRELAAVYAERLGRPRDAAGAWRAVLEVEPTDLAALDALEALYRGLAQWRDVIGVKEARVVLLASETATLSELLEIAALWRDEVHEADAGVSALERVLAVEPLHEGAFRALERLHRAAERWETLLELYLARLERVEATSEQTSLLRRIAGVYEGPLADNEQAFHALVNAFAEDFSDDETTAALERVTKSGQRWDELIGTVNGWLAGQQEPEPRIRLCLRVGKWYADDLDRGDLAQPYYAEIAKLDPHNVQVRRQMAAIHRKSAEWQKMGELLAQALNVATLVEDRVAILCDLGELAERHLGEPEKAVAYFERARDLDPSSGRVLQALERVYEARGLYAALAEVLEGKLARLAGDEERASEALRLAALKEHQLQRIDQAAEHYRQAVELGLASMEALRGVERTARALGRWKEHANALERQVEAAETKRERVEALLKLATVLEEEFVEPRLAAERLEQALELDAGRDEAYRALARCYRRLKEWARLVETYERHLDEVESRAVKVELLGAMSAVLSEHLADNERAIDVSNRLLALDPTNVPALEALAALYEAQGDAAAAIEAMGRVAEETPDPARRVALLYKAGRANEQQLGDRHAARQRYEAALDLDEGHLPTLAALRAMALDDGDWDMARRHLEAEQAHTTGPRARAKLLVELGVLCRERLDDGVAALDAFQRAVESDPDADEAALPLAEHFMAEGRFADAEPFARLIARRRRGGEHAEEVQANLLLGRALLAQGKHAEALPAFQRASDVDPSELAAVRGLADAAFHMEDWPVAQSACQRLLAALEDGDDAARADVCFRLGRIKQGQGHTQEAIQYFEKALALTGDHRPTLEALVEVYAAVGDWQEVIATKRQILDSVLEGAERFQLLVEIGGLWLGKENNTAKAIDAYEEARDLQPDDDGLLHKLLDVYNKASDWEKMAGILEALAEKDSAPRRQALVLFTLGKLYRDADKLDDAARAVEIFGRALDVNPELLDAFEAIDKLLTQQKDWSRLEREYRRMLHRLKDSGKTELLHMLWHQLGVIYRDRIGDTARAIDAFKGALDLQPENLQERQILAELFEGAGRAEEAVREYILLVQQQPNLPSAYRNLMRARQAEGAVDAAWSAAGVLSLLRTATPAEQSFFDARVVPENPPVKRALSAELWRRHLLHPDVSAEVSAVFQAITPAALRYRLDMLDAEGKRPQLDESKRQDPRTSTMTFAKTFGWVGSVLGGTVPSLYVYKDARGGITAVPSDPLATVAGSSILSGHGGAALRYLCAKHLAGFREEILLRQFFPTREELTLLFLAAVHISKPGAGLQAGTEPALKVMVSELASRLQPAQVEGVRAAVRRFEEAGNKLNVKGWLRGAELTACRAGLLVCGDLGVTVQLVGSEPQRPGEPSVEEKLRDLLVFSVGDDYLRLRSGLGLAFKS